MDDTFLGGTVCDEIFYGANERGQVCLQLLKDNEPFAFIIFDVKVAKEALVKFRESVERAERSVQ